MEKKISNVENTVEELKNELIPPEKDLMARDVLQMMMKLVVTLVVILVLIIGAFIGYSIYKDKQYNDFINSFEYETTETIKQDTTYGGNANYVDGFGDIVNGTPNN